MDHRMMLRVMGPGGGATESQPEARVLHPSLTLFFACPAPFCQCLRCLPGACMQCLHVNSDPGPGAPNWGDSPSLASHSPC